MNDLEEKIEKLLVDVNTLFSIFTPEDIQRLEIYYKTMKICAEKFNKNSELFDISYRVQLGQSMDKCLNILIDYMDCNVKISGDIYTPAIQNYRPWNNVELMKDKCLAGYMLGKEINATNFQYFCSKNIAYSLAEDLPGLELVYGENISQDLYQRYLTENYKKMDVLMLHGAYYETIVFLEQYRYLRPDGKVYCGLDLNHHYMKKIPWGDPSIKKFFSHCDVVFTSCTTIRDQLNSMPNVDFLCRYLSNAFYNPTNTPIEAKAEKKENTILAVGRIGTWPKNNEELVFGFAKNAHLLPQWNLKLVGNVEDTFLEFIEKIFKRAPHLKKQIHLLGPIMDKKKLYEEYAKAKVFAHTSVIEGGTPNVYAEALVHGCKFFTSDIDGADDITKLGTLGATYHLGDMDDFSEKLLSVCQVGSIAEEEQHIQKALAYAQEEFDWERNAKKIAYTLWAE